MKLTAAEYCSGRVFLPGRQIVFANIPNVSQDPPGSSSQRATSDRPIKDRIARSKCDLLTAQVFISRRSRRNATAEPVDLLEEPIKANIVFVEKRIWLIVWLDRDLPSTGRAACVIKPPLFLLDLI